MRIVDLILKKRDGKELNDEEIHYFIDNLVDGGIEGSQLGNPFIHNKICSKLLALKCIFLKLNNRF